jgi:membrane protein implicated in regulation of membrane protease activity
MLILAGLVVIAVLAVALAVIAAMAAGMLLMLAMGAFALAAAGGGLGWYFFHDQTAVLGGAAIGIVGGLIVIGYMSNRTQEPAKGKTSRQYQPPADGLEALAARVDQKLRSEAERFEAREALRTQAESIKTEDVSAIPAVTDGWLRRLIRKATG